MQHWKSCKVLLYLNIILVMVLSLALMGCSDDSDHGDVVNINAEEFGLTDANAAALANLSFTFPDGSIFGVAFGAQPATVTFGPDGTTFTLVGGGGTILGTIDFGSCRYEETPPGEYRRNFTTCDCIVDAQDVPEGSCADGTVQLSLGRLNLDPVDSDPTETPVCVTDNGNVTIGTIDNTPIGRLPTGGTGGTGD